MKKLLVCVLALILIGCAALAEDYTNLRDLQNYVYNTPASRSVPYGPYLHIGGVISDIVNYKTSDFGDYILNDYILTIDVDEENAADAVGHEKPCFIAFLTTYHGDMPFEVGQEVFIDGEFNSLYSSPLIPCVKIQTINGYDPDEL
jgi:hypothetical protein